MSYRDAEIADPGAQLNCIVGPNGTGKSSIVCAMCVGLGGPLKLTERGDNIKACVHGEGKNIDEHGRLITCGFVETELVDGNGPGRNLTVRLDFDVDNKKKWTMDGVSTTEKRVKEAMESLNIQVDNPLQFLPQDKVGQFSNMKPDELLKHTEMAIGPDVHKQHLELIALDKEVVVVEQRLTTERKKLEDLERINKALEQDVERFKRLQENKRRLDGFRGKKLWAEFDYHEGHSTKLKGEYDIKKAELKDVKVRYNASVAAIAPLEATRKEMEAKHKEANGRAVKADAERLTLDRELSEGENAKEAVEGEIAKLDKKLDGLRKKREEAEKRYDQVAADVDRARQQLQESSDVDPATKKAQLEAAHKQAIGAVRAASEALREHKHHTPELVTATEQARARLQGLQDVDRRKMHKIVQGNKDSAHFAKWVSDVQRGSGEGPEEAGTAQGPLLMLIDVPKREHQPLVEEAIGPKYAYAFIAPTDSARLVLNKKVADEGLNVNVYRTAGGAFSPGQRPASKDMARFGVTAWLDEAVAIAPEHRDQVLGALKDLTLIHRFLLGTKKTMDKIEELQHFLEEHNMDNVTILTPERNYRITRSRYGEKQLNNTTAAPRKKTDLFAIAADPEETEKAQREYDDAKRASDEHLDRTEALNEAAFQANEAKNAKQQQLTLFLDGRSGLDALVKRLPALQQRVDQARKEEAAFDVGAKRAELRAKLIAMAKKEMQLAARIAKYHMTMTRATTEEYGARLAAVAAKQQIADVSEEQEELAKEVDLVTHDVARLKDQIKAANDTAAKLRAEARKAAPHFEKDESGLRGGTQAHQAEYDAMPSNLDDIDAEIEALEADIASSDDDDGKTLADYEHRCKEIEAKKATVIDTVGEIEEKRRTLDTLVAAWKPKLEEMVAVVDDNFAAYFQRFKCVGRVELVDGRKLSPQTGQPDGPDDFSAYKIHIKVQWRDSEQLHVLGEGGRDSGGERSVATMVYLISLQSVNPAPFRVVDEINQAMDSTNERHVFECITHACREGGKQYFLLTPKLLPDLDYGEETAIQLVFNGVHATNRAGLTLDKFC